MPILTPKQIGDTWVAAGGNPQTANAAVTHALATSGGNTDAENGLFGFAGADADLTKDPLSSARAAIDATANGINFPQRTSDIPGVGELGSLLGSIFGGITSFDLNMWSAYLRWYIMLWTGALIALIGVLVMAFGSRPFRAALGFVGGNVLSGIGFGAGAGITSPRGEPGSGSAAGPPPLLPPGAVPASPRTPVFGPRDPRQASWATSPPPLGVEPRGTSWLAPTTEMPAWGPSPADGGPAHRPMGRVPREVTFGPPATTNRGGRHRR